MKVDIILHQHKSGEWSARARDIPGTEATAATRKKATLALKEKLENQIVDWHTENSAADKPTFRETIDLSISSEVLEFKAEGVNYHLLRIDDEKRWKTTQKSIPIFENVWATHQVTQNTNFAEAYTVLRHCFGESGNLYDDWKGAYAFAFILTITPNEEESHQYLLDISTFRSMLEHRYWKILGGAALEAAKKDNLLNAYHDPFPEFDKTRIHEFESALHQYLGKELKTIPTEEIDPFVMQIPSNLILFGYDEEDGFYQTHFENSDDFSLALEKKRNEKDPKKNDLE